MLRPSGELTDGAAELAKKTLAFFRFGASQLHSKNSYWDLPLQPQRLQLHNPGAGMLSAW